MNALPKVDSPCIDVCTLDPARGICVGCFRSVDEIAGWISFSETERRAVLERLPGRRSRFAGDLETQARHAAERRARSQCSRCGATFTCGAGDAANPCWCASYPPVRPSPGANMGCLCPTCLAQSSSGSG